jgi:hypothetical protein
MILSWFPPPPPIIIIIHKFEFYYYNNNNYYYYEDYYEDYYIDLIKSRNNHVMYLLHLFIIKKIHNKKII